ncbi:MAG: MFS transporter [Verrucomicrobia bacterium]|nr:MFS transporter [Verrucomicrobiota bacterium]
MTSRTSHLKLPHYFGIEAANACGACLFLFCIFFWTRDKFGYTDAENLLLTAVHGLTYFFATKYGGKLADRIGYDRLLSRCLLAMAAALLLGWIPTWRFTPFVVMVIYTITLGPTWPTLEAAILHSPGSASMPRRLGLYNVTWGFSDAVGFFSSGFLFGWKPDSILWATGLLHLAQWCWLRLAPRNSGDSGETAMEMPHSGDDVPASVKRRFMHSAWLANGMGFLMLAGFTALAPQVGDGLKLAPSFTIWLTCTHLFARGLAFFICWKWEGWHYRTGWSQGALWLAPAALVVAFFSKEVFCVVSALAVFGLATGLSYSGSLYYSLDYGENKGEHAGLHESMIGIGIFTGPLLAAVVSVLGAGVLGAQVTLVGLVIAGNLAGLGWIMRANRLLPSTQRGASG